MAFFPKESFIYMYISGVCVYVCICVYGPFFLVFLFLVIVTKIWSRDQFLVIVTIGHDDNWNVTKIWSRCHRDQILVNKNYQNLVAMTIGIVIVTKFWSRWQKNWSPDQFLVTMTKNKKNQKERPYVFVSLKLQDRSFWNLACGYLWLQLRFFLPAARPRGNLGHGAGASGNIFKKFHSRQRRGLLLVGNNCSRWGRFMW